MSQAPGIWTVGHSTLSIDGFIDLLAPSRIDLVADVRRIAGSRRHPQFNGANLSHALAGAGIGYVHLDELGGRREPRLESPNTGWREAGFRGYADYMETDAFAGGMSRLLGAAADRRLAVMCAEKDWRACHRGLMSDWLKLRGCDVVHILANATTEPHAYTKPARIRDGMLTYAADDAQQARLGF